MSGHSKWSNIQGVKCARCQTWENFPKVSREIYMAAKQVALTPMNPALRLAVDKAKSANMPNDNIARAIKSQ